MTRPSHVSDIRPVDAYVSIARNGLYSISNRDRVSKKNFGLIGCRRVAGEGRADDRAADARRRRPRGSGAPSPTLSGKRPREKLEPRFQSVPKTPRPSAGTSPRGEVRHPPGKSVPISPHLSLRRHTKISCAKIRDSQSASRWSLRARPLRKNNSLSFFRKL